MDEPSRQHSAAVKAPGYGRNYFLSILEGGLFMGGINFLSMEAVMPAMVHELGGPGWAVAVAPVLFIIGFAWPQIFSALWVERLRAMKPFCLFVGVLQRIPYLLTGLFLLRYGHDYPRLAWVLAIATPFVCSSMGGLIGAAYLELISRMIPVRRIASMWAIRNSLLALFGMMAGITIKVILDTYPGVTGYGILHLLVFGMMSASLFVFTFLREDNIPETAHLDPISFKSGFASFASQLRKNPSLGLYTVTRILLMSVFVSVPFFSIRAIELTGQQSSLLGMLVIPQMLGAIAGNVITGVIGDKLGVRLPMLLGRSVLIFTVLSVLFARTEWHFMSVFFFLGFGISTGLIGDLTMVIDFAPEKRRKFFFAVMGLLIVPGVLGAFLISTSLQYLDHGFYVACLISAFGLVLSLILLHRLKDPRQRPVETGRIPIASGSQGL